MARYLYSPDGRTQTGVETIEAVRIRPGIGVYVPGAGDHGHCTHETGDIPVDDATGTLLVMQGSAAVVKSTVIDIRPRLAPPPEPPGPPPFVPRKKAA